MTRAPRASQLPGVPRRTVPRELRWMELVQESGALLDRQLQARPGAGDLFRAALRHRVLHRDVVPE